MYRCRSELRCSDGSKLWWAAGERSPYSSPASFPCALRDKNGGSTLIIPSLKLFTFSFFTLISFLPLWCTRCSLSALSAAPVASLKVCLGAVNNHLFNNVRTIRRWFYANFFLQIDPPPLPPLLFTPYFYISALNVFSMQNKALNIV